ncbi:MAG: cell envelope integrity protein TolA [Pseudomonadales bacterium]|nr:cell envelope integrity protein TolA [Pseudomonadales bacterium]NIX09887.1 cell envelope integrity protein TolA [Pseudomonadales bacterium]
MPAVRDYALPLLLALLLHGLAFLSLRAGWNPETAEARAIKPQIVRSTLVVMEPKAKPAARPEAVAKVLPPARQRQEPAPPAKTPATEKPRTAAAEAEAERRSAAEAQRQERLQQLSEASFLDALETEAADLAESFAAEEAEAVAQTYRYGIYERVVANWSRPPSARNNMEARLLVELVPTGDVVSVTLIDGSGNEAFDRSAEAAVRKARRFEVPKEPEIFERYFRRFTLLFRPEDLLR